MSLFHLHARLLEGSLENLRRDELQITDSDDWNEINDLARELVAHGFTVWISAELRQIRDKYRSPGQN